MSYPKAGVRLSPPPPLKPGTYSVSVIGFDYRAVLGVDGKVRITNGSEVRIVDGPEPKGWEEPWKIVVEPILWVVLRVQWPECEYRFEVPASDVVWVNTEAAQFFNMGTLLPVIGIGYGADQKIEAYRKEMESSDG